MFRKLTSLILLAAAAIAAAQDAGSDMNLFSNERVIGYTVNNDIDVKDGAFGQAGTYPIGAYMYADDLKPYTGCRIIGMRVAAGIDLGRCRTFLYTLDGNQMSLTHEQRQRLYEGWNRVDFNGDGYTIEEGKDLFFGYDYTETEAMVAADKGGIAATGNDTEGASIFYQDGRLYNISGIGILCVQLIIDVTNMQPYEIAYGFFDTGFKYKRTTEEVEIMTTIRNVGRDNIASLRMGWQYDDLAPQYVDLPENIPSGGSYTWNQTLAKPEALAIGSHKLRIFPVRADGVEIPASDNNTRVENIALYDQTVPRDKVLMEVFTNTSSAESIGMLSVINQFGDADGTAIVATHHMPGTPLATPESQDLFDRYAYTNSVFTLDRAYFPGESHIAYSDHLQFIGMLSDDFVAGILKDMTAQSLTLPSFASISASGICTPDNSTLNLEVSIDALPEATAIYGTIAAHVMLVEDGVKSAQSTTGIGGRPITNNNYIHNNVVRLNHTGVKGRPVTLENNSARIHFEIPLQPSWDLANMRAVVYLTKYFEEEPPANLKDADVINATALPLGPLTSISEVATDTVHGPSTYYTIGGVQVSGGNLAPGLYIERRPDGTARKILVK